MISHFLHVHTARPHLLESSFDSIGIHQLGYRPYGPDIAASEFELFAYISIKLEGMFFHTLATRLAEVEDTLGDSGMTESAKVFDEWKDRLKQRIDAEGECLENEEFDLDIFFARMNCCRAPGLKAPLHLMHEVVENTGSSSLHTLI